MRRDALVICLGLALGGCYFFRPTGTPVAGLVYRTARATPSTCLLVMMPGMGDGADAFAEHGFVRAAAHGRCDIVALDSHLGYYANGTVRERVSEDVLMVARARGYQEIWLVGVSMGGLGALTVAERHQGWIAGVVLIAPFLGEAEVLDEVRRQGLEAFEPTEEPDPTTQAGVTLAVWSWLRGYRTRPDERPPLLLAYGTEDPMARDAELLASALPSERVLTMEGGHTWDVWEPLFTRLLRRVPWGVDPP